MAKNRDELIAEYAHLNEPTHDLGTSQQEQRLDAATKAALDQAMGLTAGTTGAVGSLGTPNDRLIASMNEQRSRGGLAANQDYMKVGVPLGVLAATAGAGIAESQRTVSGTPRTTVPTYTPLDDELFMALNRMEPEGTPLREQIPADEIVAMREGRGQAPYESYEYKKIGKNWVSPDGTKVSDEVMRVWMQEDIDLIKRNWPEISDQELNRTLEASQRRLAGFGSEAQTEAARLAKQAKGQAKSAIDPKKLESAVRRYFNQSAIARELSKVARVPVMAGQVSRSIPAGQAVALIAEPLMAFMSVFDDPTEGTFGISFGTQLKSMAATLTKSTGKPTPLQPGHLEPEAIQRLRDEPETAQDLYNFGALSEELWQEVKPRSGEPLVQWGEPSELPPSAVAWQEEYARQQEGE